MPRRPACGVSSVNGRYGLETSIHRSPPGEVVHRTNLIPSIRPRRHVTSHTILAVEFGTWCSKKRVGRSAAQSSTIFAPPSETSINAHSLLAKEPSTVIHAAKCRLRRTSRSSFLRMRKSYLEDLTEDLIWNVKLWTRDGPTLGNRSILLARARRSSPHHVQCPAARLTEAECAGLGLCGKERVLA
jgi:hypothetical protein